MPKSEGEWLVQCHIFPETSDGEAEHDYPYTVEYNPKTGGRRTVKLSKEAAEEVRRFNGLPNEEILGEDGEVKNNADD